MIDNKKTFTVSRSELVCLLQKQIENRFKEGNEAPSQEEIKAYRDELRINFENNKQLDVSRLNGIFKEAYNNVFDENGWRVTAKRFVVYLDLFGIKNDPARGEHEQLISLMNKIQELNAVFRFAHNNPNCLVNGSVRVISTSDSIVIYTKDNTPDTFDAFVRTLSYYFTSILFEEGLMLKGALAEGIITVSENKNVYWGQALINAKSLAQDLDCLGVVCHHSIDAYIKESGVDNSDLFQAPSPFVSTRNTISHKNVNWFNVLAYFQATKTNSIADGDETRYCKSEGLRLAEDALNDFHTIVSGSSRKYIDNTVELMKVAMQSNPYLLFPFSGV